MLEQVYDTIFALIQLGIPKDANGNCVIYDKPITGWYIGDPTPQPNIPNVSIQGISSRPKRVAQGAWEIEHSITLTVAVQQDTPEISERNVQEFARVIRNALLPHRRVWVCMKCPFDQQGILTPAHYTVHHSSILAPYLTSATNKFVSTWNETHDPGTNPAPTGAIPVSGLAAEAFNELFTDISNNVSVSGVSASALAMLNIAVAERLTYIRLLYDVEFGDIKPSIDQKEQAMRKSGEFSITAKEIIKQPAYGPDNVPTDGWIQKIKR